VDIQPLALSARRYTRLVPNLSALKIGEELSFSRRSPNSNLRLAPSAASESSASHGRFEAGRGGSRVEDRKSPAHLGHTQAVGIIDMDKKGNNYWIIIGITRHDL
jgi:hypothetical protein